MLHDVSKPRMSVRYSDSMGFEKLQEERGRVVRAFVGGQHDVVFAELLTGYGQSFVFRVVAISVRQRQKSGSIDVSPLTTLMIVKKLRQR